MKTTNYAKELTREFLELNGITEITKDARVFKGDREIFPHWVPNPSTSDYLGLHLVYRDEDGHVVKSGKTYTRKYERADGSIGESETWTAKGRTIGLHRIMWAWHYGSVPAGMVVDHIDNKHDCLYDYRLENLQLLTPRENLAKNRDDWDIRELKCRLNVPRSYYEDKLIKFIVQYEEAKLEDNAKRIHILRSQVANYRARLRYYDNHAEEAEALLAQKEKAQQEKELKKQNVKERKLLAEWRDSFREAGNKAMWHQMNDVIRKWDTLDRIQKDHVFEVLHKFFG